MRYEWDEAKRQQNLKDHGIDFVDVAKVFSGPTFTYEDDRFRYQERRYITFGLLNGVPVSLAHTETPDVIRPISFRRATTNETAIFFEKIADQLPKTPVDEGQGHPSDARAPRGKHNAHRARRRQKRLKGRAS